MAETSNPDLKRNLKELLLGVDLPKKKHPKSSIREIPPSVKSVYAPTPLKITILSGAYQGKTLDIRKWLGPAINEVNHTSGAEWSPVNSRGIRNTATFTKFTDRTIRFTLEFYHFREDVSQLSENLEVLKEITGGEINPPTLTIRQGKLIATPVVCTRNDSSFSDPLPLDGGYRYVKIDLEFLLLGGRSSQNTFSSPLAPTPFADILSRETQQERQKQGSLVVIKQQLAPCLGVIGNDELDSLIKNDKLTDKEAIAGLQPATFIQLAISGMIAPEILKSDVIQEKLKNDLAQVVASREPGFLLKDKYEILINVILKDSVKELPEDLKVQAQEAIEDYKLILEAIKNQELDDDSDIFAQTNQRAGNRLRNFGSCGITLRKVDASSVVGNSIDRDRATLSKLTLFLEKVNKGEIKDRELKKAFGLKKDNELRAIKKGAPYNSKEDFINRVSQSKIGVSGQILWGKFTKYQIPEDNPADGGV